MMYQDKKMQKGITLVALIVTMIILIILAGISLNVTIGENGIITKAKQAKQNITLAGEAEAMQLNQLYYELETGGELTEDEESSKKDEIISLLQKQVEELQKQVADLQTENTELKKQIQDLTEQIANLQQEIESLKQQITNKDIEITELKKQVSEKEAKIQELQNQLNNLNSLLLQTNATADKILSGYKAYSGGKLLTGTMVNNGTLKGNLNCGQTYPIPAGYTSGGTVTANSLASQTQATAQANQILSGKTAYVNGNLIQGTMADRGAISKTLKPGESYTIPQGYHYNGTVTASNIQVGNGGTNFFYDDISDPNSSSNAGISEKRISVTKGKYVIISVNLRFKSYDSDTVSMSCTSGMDVISYTTNEAYSKWYATFGQSYTFFGYTTADTITLKSSKAYRWAGFINYINIQ